MALYSYGGAEYRVARPRVEDDVVAAKEKKYGYGPI